MSLPEKNIEVSIEKQRKRLKELNSLVIIFNLQAQKLIQVNSKKQSPDVIISSQCFFFLFCFLFFVFCFFFNLVMLGWRVKRVET